MEWNGLTDAQKVVAELYLTDLKRNVLTKGKAAIQKGTNVTGTGMNALLSRLPTSVGWEVKFKKLPVDIQAAIRAQSKPVVAPLFDQIGALLDEGHDMASAQLQVLIDANK